MKQLSRHQLTLVNTSPEEVFTLWSRPATWSAWDPDVREVDFASPAGHDLPPVGATGTLHPASGPSSTFTFTVVEPERRVTTTSRLPGATLTFDHVVENHEGGHPEGCPGTAGTCATVTITVSGPLSGVLGLALGRVFKDAARRNLEGLAAYLGSR